jgi:cell cycle arrest protein BUB2
MAKPQPSWGLGIPGPDTPASPRTLRTLRKIQSHQVLSSSSALIAQTQASYQSGSNDMDSTGLPGAATRARAHRRARSNSDAAAREATTAPPVTQRRPARKTGSGIGLKRSLLENYLRDGPPSGDPREGLQELKYLVLSSRVDADGDGMVSFHTPLKIHRLMI